MSAQRFVIVGATGDLTGRYLLPALARLRAEGYLKEDLEVLGVARDAWDGAHFRRHAALRIAQHAPEIGTDTREAVVASLGYARADVTVRGQLTDAIGDLAGPSVFYLALPPQLAKPAIEALASMRPAEGSRVVIEKPFGTDLASATELNRIVHERFPERMVFRMDHFLGHETVMNVLGLRFANRIFEPIWSRAHVARVEITWDETLTLEGRASYYDGAGALRDMIQNHLLQVLSLVAMEPPLGFGERDLRDRKAELLRSVRKMTTEEATRRSVRARYASGRIDERDIPAYASEPGIDPARKTETFAEIELAIDNWRWSGVPFVLRTGKALGKSRREIAVHFQEVPFHGFGSNGRPAANVLRIQLDPDRMSLLTNISNRRGGFALEQIALDSDLSAAPLPAYARLLLDILAGDVTLSIRDDEAEECWRIVEPFLEAWRQDLVPLLEYAGGSSGPKREGGAGASM